MGNVIVTCPDCGDIQIESFKINVRVCADDNKGSYSFRCSDCDMVVVKPAEPQIVDLLVASGAPLSTWRLPAELAEPHNGASVTHDEVLDFHDFVTDDSAFDAEIAKLLGQG